MSGPNPHSRRSGTKGKERSLHGDVPALLGARFRTVLLRLGRNAGDDQPLRRAGQRHVKQPPVLFEVAFLFGENAFLEWRAALLFFGPKQGCDTARADFDIQSQRRAAHLAWVRSRVGKDNHRRLEALGPVHSHHAHLVAAAARVALHIDRPAREPCEKAIQRRGFGPLELKRAVDQFVDGIPRGHPEPAV